MEKLTESAGEAAERVQSIGKVAADAVSATGRIAAGLASEAGESAAELAGDLKDRASQTAHEMRAAVGAASDTAKDGIDWTRQKSAAAPEAARQMIGDNAALIAGLGVAIGSIIAASLPDTKAEADAIGKASDGVKRAAAQAAQSGFETAKDAVLSAADAAAKSVSDADLGKHASRVTQNMSERLREAADDIVSAAFNPTLNEEKRA
jgi:hypothetical protein